MQSPSKMKIMVLVLVIKIFGCKVILIKLIVVVVKKMIMKLPLSNIVNFRLPNTKFLKLSKNETLFEMNRIVYFCKLAFFFYCVIFILLYLNFHFLFFLSLYLIKF